MSGARDCRDALVVFARAPERGRVKTRLAAALGPDEALAIYTALGARIVQAVAPLGAGGDAPCAVVVAGTPDDALGGVRQWIGEGATLEPQGDGDLGARMARAIARRLAAGAERVVVIGTDCPDVDAAVVREALAALADHDVVVGPALDGGYYLVGVHRRAAPRALPALFDGIPWSSPETLGVTLRRAAGARLRVARLAPRRDIDTAADWAAWCARSEA